MISNSENRKQENKNKTGQGLKPIKTQCLKVDKYEEPEGR